MLQDMHSFAYRAAGLTGPDAVQEKLLLVLDTLNTHPQQQQPGLQQQQQPGLDQLPSAAVDADHAEELFSLADLQAAARRDQKWLQLSVSTLEQRLRGMQQELGVSVLAAARGNCMLS